MNNGRYLILMCLGYLITIAVETAILVVALSKRHPLRHRIFAGIWLTACTYPIVWLVLPAFVDPRTDRSLYLWIAETFAPVAECALFWFAFCRNKPPSPNDRKDLLRDMIAIVVANTGAGNVGVGDPFHIIVEAYYNANFLSTADLPEPSPLLLCFLPLMILLGRGAWKGRRL